MRYLMFMYGESETMSSEELTDKIGKEIQPIVNSEQIKYIYGDGNAIFHFQTELKYEEMSIYIGMVFEDFEGIMFTLIPFNGKMATNMGKDRENHLLSINEEEKFDIKTFTVSSEDIDNNDGAFFDMFIDIIKQNNPFIIHKKNEDICNMTLDELLDKINEEGMDSLTKAEKLKLEEYSK
jgi:hypothetical protein